MKTMIANAEKLEKVSELIEVENNNVTFGGNLLVDGAINKSDNSVAFELDAQASAVFFKSNLKNNTLYAISFEYGTTTTIFYKEGASTSSAVTYVFSDDTMVYVYITEQDESRMKLSVYTSDGSAADILGGFEVEFIPLITYI